MRNAKLSHGHAPGHVCDAFGEAAEAFMAGGTALPSRLSTSKSTTYQISRVCSPRRSLDAINHRRSGVARGAAGGAALAPELHGHHSRLTIRRIGSRVVLALLRHERQDNRILEVSSNRGV